MVGRRDFLKFLGLAGAVALTPAMVEALAEEKGLGTVPGEILDKIPRPLVVTVPSNKIIRPTYENSTKALKEVYAPGLPDAYFKSDPLMAYMEADKRADEWRARRGQAPMPPIWVMDEKNNKVVLNSRSYYFEKGDGRVKLLKGPVRWPMGVK